MAIASTGHVSRLRPITGVGISQTQRLAFTYGRNTTNVTIVDCLAGRYDAVASWPPEQVIDVSNEEEWGEWRSSRIAVALRITDTRINISKCLTTDITAVIGTTHGSSGYYLGTCACGCVHRSLARSFDPLSRYVIPFLKINQRRKKSDR